MTVNGRKLENSGPMRVDAAGRPMPPSRRQDDRLQPSGVLLMSDCFAPQLRRALLRADSPSPDPDGRAAGLDLVKGRLLLGPYPLPFWPSVSPSALAGQSRRVEKNSTAATTGINTHPALASGTTGVSTFLA